MKKLFPTLALACFSLPAAQAQITIFSDDVTPSNVEATLAFDLNPDQSLEPGGTGQLTWDFSAMLDDSTATYKFVDVAATPYASTFPSATLASQQGENYYYFNKDNDVLGALGLYGDLKYDIYVVTTAITVSPFQSILRFPAMLNDSFSETVVRKAQTEGSSINAPFDSVRIVSTVQREVNIDAYGMMTTPIGTFQTIRSSEVETTTDQVFVYSAATNIWSPLPAGSPYTNHSFSWWTNDNNFGFPVVQIQWDPVDGVLAANWVKDFVSAAYERPGLEFSIYPNPAPNELFIRFPEHFQGTLEVVNLNGLVMEQQQVNGVGVDVSTQSFINGTYQVLLRNEKGKLVGSKPFHVLR